jgi:DNA-binding CsgD family transcriptional regulator
VIRVDERERHVVWNEFYFKVDMHHMCFTPLWRGGDSVLGLFLLRSGRDGPVKSDERRLFMQTARTWRDSAMLAKGLKEDGARVLAGALDTLSIHTVILDGIGRCAHLSPFVESLAGGGNFMSVRSQRLRLSSAMKATTQCPLVGRKIRVDADLQPCTDCAARAVQARRPCARNCAISVMGPNGLSMSLRISSIPRHHHEIPFGAAAILVIELPQEDRVVGLLPDVAAVLTTAEREVALELLRGRRPVEIAATRKVSIETIRSQIKQIYAKLEVKSIMEFGARARR